MTRPEPRSGWRPTPLVGVSMSVAAVAAAMVVVQPALWTWSLAMIAAALLVLTVAVFRPRGRWLGANLTRLPPGAAARNLVSLTFDDGPDPEVTPGVLDLLDRHGAKASFFCVAEKAAAHPELAREIVRRGHSVENHSLRHSAAFALYGFFRLRRDVARAQETLAAITGRAPAFFRAPVGLRSPLLDPILGACGLSYVSWTRRGLDGIDHDAARVLQRLVASLAPGDILLLHDGARSRTRAGMPVVLEVLPVLLERIAARGLRCVALPAALLDDA